MVKILLGGENVKCSFGEDINIVFILRGKDDFILFDSNGEFCGKGSLSNMFIIK